MNSKTVQKIIKRETPNDEIYTPYPIVKYMIDLNKKDVKKNDLVLDPSRGDNKIFYNDLIKIYNNVDYCEIKENKDFLLYNKKVDYIIGNPPYSILNDFINKSLEISNMICFFILLCHLTPSRLNNIFNKGFYIYNITICKIDFFFNTSIIITLKKGDMKKQKTKIYNIYGDMKCDICNKRCYRGRIHGGKKYGLNECSNINQILP